MRVNGATNLLSGSILWSYGLSLAVHGALLCLILFGWSRSHRVEQALHSEQTDGRIAQARDQVGEIKRIEQQLTGARDRREAEYREWARQQSETASQDIHQRLKEAAQRMEAAETTQQKATELQQRVRKRLETASPQTHDQKDYVEQGAQLNAEVQEAKRKQEQARDTANEAIRQQREALKTFDFVHNPDESVRQPLQATLRQAEDAWAAQTQAIEMQRQDEEYARQLQEALKALAGVEAQRKSAEASAKQAQTHLQTASKNTSGKPTSAATQTAIQTKPITPTASQWDALLNAHRFDVQQKRQILTQSHTAAERAHAEAQSKQRAATQSQKDLADLAEQRLPHSAVKQETSGPHFEGHLPGPEGPHTGEDGSGVSGMQGVGDLQGKDIASLYHDAVAAEQRSAEAERQSRAFERAVSERTPAERILPSLDSRAPIRPALQFHDDFAGIASAAPGTKSESQIAEEEIASILASGRSMMHDRHAPGHGPEGHALVSENRGLSVGLAGIRESGAEEQRTLAYAMEEDNRPAKDLTAVMKEQEGRIGLAGGKNSVRYKPSPQPGPDLVGPSAPPTLSPALNIQAIPGRRVQSGGASAAWMFVDSWHIIGPFPNPQRSNLNRSFPPEAGVDLDAQYAGKDNRIVQWNFVQTGGPMIVPPQPEEYAIYYGYTELWFDKPRDLWIALGRDDKSHLWINDQLVWVSSDVLKGWRIDEGLRRVHFRQGRNRVLFRLENGWRGLGFSFVISLKP